MQNKNLPTRASSPLCKQPETNHALAILPPLTVKAEHPLLHLAFQMTRQLLRPYITFLLSANFGTNRFPQRSRDQLAFATISTLMYYNLALFLHRHECHWRTLSRIEGIGEEERPRPTSYGA